MTACSVVLNGNPTPVAADTTLPELVRALTGFLEGVAVAVNGEVVPAACWDSTSLRDGDAVEVLVATQGG